MKEINGYGKCLTCGGVHGMAMLGYEKSPVWEEARIEEIETGEKKMKENVSSNPTNFSRGKN